MVEVRALVVEHSASTLNLRADVAADAAAEEEPAAATEDIGHVVWLKVNCGGFINQLS